MLSEGGLDDEVEVEEEEEEEEEVPLSGWSRPTTASPEKYYPHPAPNLFDYNPDSHR